MSKVKMKATDTILVQAKLKKLGDEFEVAAPMVEHFLKLGHAKAEDFEKVMKAKAEAVEKAAEGAPANKALSGAPENKGGKKKKDK